MSPEEIAKLADALAQPGGNYFDQSNLGFDTQPGNPMAGLASAPSLQGLADKLREEYQANLSAMNAPAPAPSSRSRVATNQALAGVLGFLIGGGRASSAAQGTAANLTEQLLATNDATAVQEHASSLKAAENAIKSRDELAKGLRMLYQSHPEELRKDPVLSELAFPSTADYGSLFEQSSKLDGPAAKMRQDYWYKAIKSGDLQGESLTYAHNELAKAYGVPKQYVTSDMVDVDGGITEKWAWEYVVDPWPVVQQLREGKQLTVKDVQVKSPHRQPTLNSEQLNAMKNLALVIKNAGGLDRMTVPEGMTKLDEFDQILLDALRKDELFRGKLSMEDMVRIRIGLQRNTEKYNPGSLLSDDYIDKTFNDALGAAQYDSQRALTSWFNNEMDAEMDRVEAEAQSEGELMTEEEIEDEARRRVKKLFKRRGYGPDNFLPGLQKQLEGM